MKSYYDIWFDNLQEFLSPNEISLCESYIITISLACSSYQATRCIHHLENIEKNPKNQNGYELEQNIFIIIIMIFVRILLRLHLGENI